MSRSGGRLDPGRARSGEANAPAGGGAAGVGTPGRSHQGGYFLTWCRATTSLATFAYTASGRMFLVFSSEFLA